MGRQGRTKWVLVIQPLKNLLPSGQHCTSGVVACTHFLEFVFTYHLGRLEGSTHERHDRHRGLAPEFPKSHNYAKNSEALIPDPPSPLGMSTPLIETGTPISTLLAPFTFVWRLINSCRSRVPLVRSDRAAGATGRPSEFHCDDGGRGRTVDVYGEQWYKAVAIPERLRAASDQTRWCFQSGSIPTKNLEIYNVLADV
jgi:hypothetical protein